MPTAGLLVIEGPTVGAGERPLKPTHRIVRDDPVGLGPAGTLAMKLDDVPLLDVAGAHPPQGRQDVALELAAELDLGRRPPGPAPACDPVLEPAARASARAGVPVRPGVAWRRSAAGSLAQRDLADQPLGLVARLLGCSARRTAPDLQPDRATSFGPLLDDPSLAPGRHQSNAEPGQVSVPDDTVAVRVGSCSTVRLVNRACFGTVVIVRPLERPPGSPATSHQIEGRSSRPAAGHAASASTRTAATSRWATATACFRGEHDRVGDLTGVADHDHDGADVRTRHDRQPGLDHVEDARERRGMRAG